MALCRLKDLLTELKLPSLRKYDKDYYFRVCDNLHKKEAGIWSIVSGRFPQRRIPLASRRVVLAPFDPNEDSDMDIDMDFFDEWPELPTLKTE